MVGIKGKGDIHQSWEDEIPDTKKIGGKTYHLYLTYIHKWDAENSAEKTRLMFKKLQKRNVSVRVIPTRIRSVSGFTVYPVYVEQVW